MSKNKFSIVNEETGEVIVDGVSFNELSSNIKNNITKNDVDAMMMSVGTDFNKIDMDMLYKWCKIIKEINRYNQIAIKGVWRDDEVECSICDENIAKYILKSLRTANKYSSFMKISQNLFITKWSDLFEIIGASKRDTQKRVKSFLEDNNLVRLHYHIGRDGKKVTKFVVNPFLYRNSYYISEIAVHVFQDFVKIDENISSYVVRLMEYKEVIDKIKI